MRFAPAARILAAAAVCAASLIAVVANENAARESGQEVRLRMEGVDPRSLLSGHYVALALTERLPPGAACPPMDDWSWVALRRDGEAYTLVGGANSRDSAQQVGPLPVRGSFVCVSPGEPDLPGWVTLDLGVDRFHVSQREAERIERALREANAETPAYALVSIGRDGRARLRAIIVDGQRYDLSLL
jgi:hypothetical protein